MSLKQRTSSKSAMQEGSHIPVIFPLDSDTPFSPSISSDSSHKPQSFAYLAELSRKHEAFLKVMQEAPFCSTESDDEIDQEARDQRVSSLRQRVGEAWLKADGNPSDSKWIFLTHLLRLSVTSGRNGRWIGVKPDIPASEEMPLPGVGWINAKTDTEWKEWEKKYNQERRVKDKVKNWQKKVVSPSKRPSLQGSQGSIKATTRAAGAPSSKTSLNVVDPLVDPLQSAAPLGFPVVKRLSQKNIAGKPSNSNKTPSQSDKANDLSAAKRISDVAELSFHPPSFRSSQLATSTPNPPAKLPTSKSRKPDLVSHIAPPTPPTPSIIPDSDKQGLQSSSPQVTKTYGRHNKLQTPSQPLVNSASLPAIPIPTTPTRASNDKQNGHPAVDESFINANNKRVFSSPTTPSNGDRALKKARTLPQSSILETSLSTPPPRIMAGPDQILTTYPRTPKTPTNDKRTTAAFVPPAAAAPVPITSSSPLSSPSASSIAKKPAVPTLLELLASAKKKNKHTSKPSSKGKAKEVLPQTSISEEQESAAQQEAVDNAPTEVTPAPFIFPNMTTTTTTVTADESAHAGFDIPDHFALAEKDPLFLLDDDPIANISPTKSLSSLAGSDSEDDDDDAGGGVEDPDNLGFSFRPLATSTQRGPFAGAGSSQNGYFKPIVGGVESQNENENENENSHNANANARSQLGHMELSQSTKDSWESIYAPSGDRPLAPAAAAPPAMSAMSMSMPASSSSNHHHYVYNSQFNTGVAKNVDDVDRLLQQDVDLAYSGWIRDPYADEEQEGDGIPDSSP